MARKYFGFSDTVDALMEESSAVMKQHGATLVDPADIPTLGKFDDSESLVFMYELKADLNAYLARLVRALRCTPCRKLSTSTSATGKKRCPTSGRTYS